MNKTNEDCCGEENECGCCDDSCGGSMTETLLGIAQDAKTELLVEKLKKKLEVKYGKQMDRLADLLVEAMELKMKDEKDVEKIAELDRKINEALME